MGDNKEQELTDIGPFSAAQSVVPVKDFHLSKGRFNNLSLLVNRQAFKRVLNAICSDGRIYSKDWKESIYNEETESTSKNFLTIGYSGNAYTKIAFKNLAIYPTVLSREDCIKAYNYLQTLKAK